MASCIYCGASADSAEHWLPRTLGAFKGIERLKDRLCDGCNKALGKELDQEIANTGMTGFLKHELNISGSHGISPKNVFMYKVLGQESATTMTMDSPDGTHKILSQTYKAESGKSHGIALRQLVFKRANGDMVPVPFPPAYDAERLRKLFKERGVNVEGDTLHSIYLDNDEPLEDNMEIRRVLTDALGGNFSAIAYGGIDPGGKMQQVQVAAGITKAYVRGLAKIGFHYYLAMSQGHTGHELLFQPIRNYIRHGEGDSSNFIALTSPHFIPPLAEGKAPAVFTHFFGYQVHEGKLIVFLQLFVGPGHVPPPSRVLLGLTKKSVQTRLHRATYYGEKRDGYDGELESVPLSA